MESEKQNEETVIINIPPISEWSMAELRKFCKRNKVKGYLKMERKELVEKTTEIVENIKRLSVKVQSVQQ